MDEALFRGECASYQHNVGLTHAVDEYRSAQIVDAERN